MQVFKAAASLEAPTKTDEEGGLLMESLAVDGRPDETVSQVCRCCLCVWGGLCVMLYLLSWQMTEHARDHCHRIGNYVANCWGLILKYKQGGTARQET